MMDEFKTMFDFSGWRNGFLLAMCKRLERGCGRYMSILISEPLRSYCMVWTLLDILMFQILMISCYLVD